MMGVAAVRGRLDALDDHPRRLWRLVVGIVAAGVLVRLALAPMRGPSFDIANILLAADALEQAGLSFYAALPAADPIPTYPYLPGYVPWAIAVGFFVPSGGLEWVLLRLPVILADAALALLAARLVPGGAAAAVAAAALLSLHPVAVVNAGVWGQLEPLAFLPVLGAAAVWRAGGPSRAAGAGLLIGVGVLFKTPAALGLLALLPLTASLREASVLLAAAAALPLAVLAPFAIAEPAATLAVLDYRGLPGAGGLSLLIQPGLADSFGGPLSGISRALQHAAPVLQAVGLVGAMVVVRRRRLGVLASFALVMLVTQIAFVNWFAHYALWALPFAVAAGAQRWVAASALPLTAFVLPDLGVSSSLLAPAQVAATAVYLAIVAAAIRAVLGAAPGPR